MPFRKVLIANRGEIACRIIRTLRDMGIASVAIHHRVEAGARHVRMADRGGRDHRRHAGGGASRRRRRSSRPPRATGADAIHPGYGFLSENAGFARAVAEAGLTFIGPDAGHHRADGRQDLGAQLRRGARRSGRARPSMPTDDLDAFVGRGAKVGFPLLIKAAAGGGGKGMSIVRSAAELARGGTHRRAAKRKRYFGDGRVYAELYVERPRHIEVQVLGDGKGNAIHLFERECSVQRRFQKIIEEAPAANLPAPLRERICAAAVAARRAPRLQECRHGRVHPRRRRPLLLPRDEHAPAGRASVTEMITGLDLVRAQIEIAAGHGLPLGQSEIVQHGHAIECRICAEDPGARLHAGDRHDPAISASREAPFIRFENALDPGQKITGRFRPDAGQAGRRMAPDRDEAIARVGRSARRTRRCSASRPTPTISPGARPPGLPGGRLAYWLR